LPKGQKKLILFKPSSFENSILMRLNIFLFRFLLTLCFSALSFGLLAQSAPLEPVNIEITIDGLNNGKVYLIGIFGDQFFRADSSSIDNKGTIKFTRNKPYDAGFYYVHDNAAITLQLLLDQDQQFIMHTSKNDLTGSMNVNGSLDNELLYNNLKFEAAIQPQFKIIEEQLKAEQENSPSYKVIKVKQDSLVALRKLHLESFAKNYPTSFFTKFKSAGQNPEPKNPLNPDGSLNKELQLYLYKNDFWSNVDFDDVRLLRTPIVSNKLKKYMQDYTVQVADSVIASADYLIQKVLNKKEYYQYFCNWIAINYDPEKAKIMDPQAVRVHLTKNYFTLERAFWFKETPYEVDRLQQRAAEMEASLVGLKGPNVTAKDPSGQLKSIYDMKSPYIVVYMYNPTCEHCMEETPKLVSFYNEWKTKGLDVYAIALDTDDAEWKGYIAEVGMTWTNVFDPTNKSIYKKYYVDITPELYLLGPDRTIIAKNLKTFQLADVINQDIEKRKKN
jgi:thiol-disulfide isomerase/thioredoxin